MKFNYSAMLIYLLSQVCSFDNFFSRYFHFQINIKQLMALENFPKMS